LTETIKGGHIPSSIRSTAHTGSVDLMAVADARVVAEQRACAELRSELSRVERCLEQSQEAVAHREAEVRRIAKQLEGGRDIDKLSMAARNDANEGVILNLNQQVDFLTAQLGNLEGEAVERQRAEAALAATMAERDALAERLRVAGTELERIRSESIRLSETVATRHLETARVGGSNAKEIAEAMSQLQNLRAELTRSAAAREALKAENEALLSAVKSKSGSGSGDLRFEAATAMSAAQNASESRERYVSIHVVSSYKLRDCSTSLRHDASQHPINTIGNIKSDIFLF
jgi:hypothetical protein